MKFLVIFLFFFSGQFGVCCPGHCPGLEKNQKIFAELIENMLETQQGASGFFVDIDSIGKEAVEKGLDFSCYQDSQSLSYQTFVLWEGKKRCSAVFLLYVWPSEEEALKYRFQGYKTNIHSHPFPCAYTVLLGEITERRYEQLPDRSIQLCGKQIFHVGEKAVDINKEPFIHQLLFEGKGTRRPAVTLHVYGCPSLEDLIRIYRETYAEHVYPESCVIN